VSSSPHAAPSRASTTASRRTARKGTPHLTCRAGIHLYRRVVTDDATPTTVPDHWELRADRTAVLWLDGKPFRLRAPKMGEFRTIREDTLAAHDNIAKAINEAQRRQTEIVAETKAGTLTMEEAKAEVRRLSDDINDLTEQTHWGSLRDVIALLCTTPLPAEPDLPPWLVTQAPSEIADLVKHWQSVPPPPGASE